MGTVQVVFEEELWGGATGSDRKWRDRKWPEVTWQEEAMFGSVLCACSIGSCALSALVGPFSPEVTKSRDQKRSCPALLFVSHTSPRTFFPYYFSRTFFPYFFLPYYFPGFFSRIIFPYYFGVFFSLNFFPIFFFYRTFFSVLFFTRIFLTVLFSRTFSKSRDFWNPTFQNISELFFLVHVVITQFMFLAEYPFKRHP